ncbi:MAG: kinase [Tissierellia bacterium]|nr:kinase [Tissierellia bacterium]
MGDKPYITIVGGANIDIIGRPYEKLRMKDSNPGKTTITLGGVGRNIGENLARLGIDTKLITVLGDDLYGRLILEKGNEIGLDISESLILKNRGTSTYLAILDEKGDMNLALSSMDILNQMDIPFIKEKKDLIESSSLCIVDTNLPKEVLEYMVSSFKVDFFLDTVSTRKAEKVKDILGYFHTIKPNRLEAEVLSDIRITDKGSLRKAASFFLDMGVKRVIITLGEEGVYYLDDEEEIFIRSPKISVVNATGAGDAFMAGLAYAYFNGLDIEKSIKIAMGASFVTLENENTINPDIGIEKIERRIKELKL